MALAYALHTLASPYLRRDIEEILRNDPWALLEPVS